MAVKSHSCPSWHFQRLGLLDSGNVDIVAVEESQQFSDFAADSARVLLRQSQTVGGCWCPVQGSFRYNQHTEAEVGAAVTASAATPSCRRFDE